MPVSTHLSQVSTAENLRDKNLRDRAYKRPILQGFAVFAAGSAHCSIARNFAISFASRVV